MIWTVDPLTFCFATLILVTSLLVLGGKSRAVRTTIVGGGLLAYLALRISFGESFVVAASPSQLSILAATAAIFLSVLAASSTFGYWFSLFTLLAIAASIAGFADCPIGWNGLLHQVAVLDLAGVCVATTFLGISHSITEPIQPQPDDRIDPDRISERTEAECAAWIQLPPRLARRAALMFLICCGTLTYAIYSDPQFLVGGSSKGVEGSEQIVLESGLIKIWALGSEVLAAMVAWRVTHRWLHPGGQAEKQGWRLKLGLFVAGTAASLGLLLIPVIISAAEIMSPLLN